MAIRIEKLEQAPGEEKKIEGEGEIDRGGCKEARSGPIVITNLDGV